MANGSLNIINPEAIETLIRELVSYLPPEQAPEYQAWAIVALKPVIQCCPELFKPVTELPDGAPVWLTAEKLVHGTYHRFAPRDDERSMRTLERIDWLAMWLNAAFLGHVRISSRALPASWFRGLRHIRNLDDAMARARRDLAAWAPSRPSLMKHCLKSASYRSELHTGRARFFSLRTPAGDPKLTLRVSRSGEWEAYGYRNKAAQKRDVVAVQTLLDEITQESQSSEDAAIISSDEAEQRSRELSLESFVCLLRSQDQELCSKATETEGAIEHLIAVWLAGTSSDLTDLYERLLDELSRSHDREACEQDDGEVKSDAFHHVEDAIREMEPTALNLRRVMGWCRNWTSAAGHEALLTKFWDLLDAEQQARYLNEARKTWIPEVVQDWLGERY